jgi:large subunit ribosomal protein L5
MAEETPNQASAEAGQSAGEKKPKPPKKDKAPGEKGEKGEKQAGKQGGKSGKAPAAPVDTGPRTPPRLQVMFRETIAKRVMQEFNLRNVNQIPRLAKITVNVGVGKQLENQKLKPEYRDTVIQTLTTITGQKPIMIKAKKSVSNFKVREGSPSAFAVTMRRDRMWHFLDRLINLAVPRIKDFRGLKDNAFDPRGNYSIGLAEQAVWPEINMASVNFSHGMNINVVFDRSNPRMSEFVLRELGMPLMRKEDKQAAGAR